MRFRRLRHSIRRQCSRRAGEGPAGREVAAAGADLACQATAIHLAAQPSTTACRLLAGDRRRPRLRPGRAESRRPFASPATDGALPPTRGLSRGHRHLVRLEGGWPSAFHPFKRLAENAPGGRENAGIAASLDAVLSAEAVGVFKPHPSVYRLAVDRLGVSAEQMCFISSNSWDAFSAKAFGYRVLWCNRFGQRPERIPERPDGEIADLASLPEIVL